MPEPFEITLETPWGGHDVNLTQEDCHAISEQLGQHATVVMIDDVPVEYRYAIDIYNAAMEYFAAT